METKAHLDKVYLPSENVVARDIQGELIIIPITSGVGDLEDEIFTLNETGRAIWDKLDGKRSLKNVGEEFGLEFQSPTGEITKDVLGLVEELLKRRMVAEVGK